MPRRAITARTTPWWREPGFDLMALRQRTNRLSPPIMWAFREAHDKRDARTAVVSADDDGVRAISGRTGNARAAVTEVVLRREVWRDLEALLNTVALESSEPDLFAFDHVRRSIVNYGLPDMAHRSIDELRGNNDAIEHEIEAVLKAFEPRLISETVKVHRDATVDPVTLTLRYVIHADLSCKPVNIPIEFTAEVELDSGKMVVNRL